MIKHMRPVAHHLIFEGAELTGKSFIISQIYDYLEKKYSSSNFPFLLDGCFWINADIGAFGLPEGKKIIKNYINLADSLKKHNLIFEKLHISNQVYSYLYRKKTINHQIIEKELMKLNFKIIFLEIDKNKKIFEKRLQDRLKIHPHYERISQGSDDYLKQQQQYQKFIEHTKLPLLRVNTSVLPNQAVISNILKWLKET